MKLSKKLLMPVSFFILIFFFSLTPILKVNALQGVGTEIPLPVIGAKQCVCKGSSCESSNFVSFRKKCGKEPCSKVNEELQDSSNPKC